MLSTASVAISVSEGVMFGSVDRYQRTITASPEPLPRLPKRRLKLRVNDPPADGLSSLTVGDPTTRSELAGTVTVTDEEQLLPVADSSVTASTHAP